MAFLSGTGMVLKKKRFSAGLLVLFMVAALMLFASFTTPQEVAAHTIDQVRTGQTDQLDLSSDQLDQIRSIYLFAETNRLSVPTVSFQETKRTAERVQVVAYFEMLEYGEDSRVKQAHSGRLIFTLQKIGWRDWKVTEVEKR